VIGELMKKKIKKKLKQMVKQESMEIERLQAAGNTTDSKSRTSSKMVGKDSWYGRHAEHLNVVTDKQLADEYERNKKRHEHRKVSIRIEDQMNASRFREQLS